MGWFSNAPLKRKQIYLAIATGVTSTLAVLIVGGVMGTMGPKATPTPATVNKSATKAPTAKKTETKPKTSGTQPAKTNDGPPLLLIALGSGLLTGAGTWLLGLLLIRQIKETIDDLQNQFDAIYEGNFNVRAKVLSEDELGQLAQRFNYISQVILTATTEAQERASATEKAREKLQRQVIRLLDDVEGASRGDLTVQAEVTADELGAVADAFNLTIQNLCEIVRQVKGAAKQVNRNSTDSEAFARNNSSDALRMAEELAVTLNSVQLMTESIQRVAENAHEAEEVAHTSSVTALKGGEAVERTVGGILQIRETVSETARKVKRLAEASQEISKIVAVISQIASRTNLLALNASIQAARAGEAGRGFAIVADEVRQLADRSAKSLKEIEQIVLQIQSETGSVMTAMEEGIQQVIDVTDKS
jgi:twitching motility protein PilJ